VRWHVVRFDFSGVAEEARRSLEARMSAFSSIPSLAWVLVGRDPDQPSVTGLLTAFRTVDDLEAYRVHPDHVAFGAALAAVPGVTVTRLDVDGPEAWPRAAL
jgi:Stress responsive A/B Barrel Domain